VSLPRHPARILPFDRLVRGLEDAVRKRAVYAADDGDLRLYHYTDGCVYDGLWDAFSLLARGLVVDRQRKEVVATPFPKFFNLGERGGEPPDEPSSLS
jgi:RNA ligase